MGRRAGQLRTIAILGSLICALCLAVPLTASARHRPPRRSRPTARLTVSDRILSERRALTASVARSHAGRGSRIRRIVVRFGDGRRALLGPRQRTARHRYRRHGRFTITATVIDRDGGQAVLRRRIFVTRRPGVVARRGTVFVRSDLVTSYEAPRGSRPMSVTLRRSPERLHKGTIMVVGSGGAAAQGTIAVVTGVHRSSDGTTTVTAAYSDLASAYSRFSIDVHRRRVRRAMLLAPGGRTAGSARPADLSALPVTCSTADGVTVTTSADFSDTHVDATFDVQSRAIHFLLVSHPALSLGIQFAGSASCSLADDDGLQLTLPIAAPLTLTVRPYFTLADSGSFTATASWSPRITIGFDRAPGINQNVAVIGNTAPDYNWNGSASAELTAGLSVELGLGGRVGVTGTFGPDVTATMTDDGTQACATLQAALAAQLTADADVFIAHWSWTLFSGRFDPVQLLHACHASPGGGGGGGGGTTTTTTTTTPTTTTTTSTTPPPPAGPSITATKGGADSRCGGCYDLAIALHDFPTGSYTYACHDNSGTGGSDTVFHTDQVTVADPNQSTWPGVFCYDSAPYTAYLVMDGVRSNSVPFG